jgi:hypothetical protein
MSASHTLSPAVVVARIAAAVLGGYAFCWGFIALGVAGLFALGMPFHDAEQLASILAFLLYLVIFLWAFATPRLLRAWALLLGGGGLMAGLASVLQQLLISSTA